MSKRQVTDLQDRFEKHFVPEPNTGCWLWIGGLQNGGYGAFYFNTGMFAAHRVGYEIYKDKIPDGLTLDHKCRVRSCVNPDHLEVVTLKENILRGTGMSARNIKKTHCKNGHPFTDENTAMYQNARHCRKCYRDAYHRKQRLNTL